MHGLVQSQILFREWCFEFSTLQIIKFISGVLRNALGLKRRDESLGKIVQNND